MNKKKGLEKKKVRIFSLLIGVFILLVYFYLNIENVNLKQNLLLIDKDEIYITQAQHLDSERNFLNDIYFEVGEKDNLFKYIPEGDYVRVTFEKNLTNENDITIYAKSVNQSVVEVYSKDSSKLITQFDGITFYNKYQVLLNNLFGIEDTFDLKILGSSLYLDYILDPIVGGTTTGGLRPQNVTCYTNGLVVACSGSYPANCGTDRLSCNDASEEAQTTKKSDYAGVDAIFYNNTITDCVEVLDVQACYEWRSSNANPTICAIDYDNSGDGWSNIISACPGVAGASGCQNITVSESWVCSNFFDTSGNRARLRSRQTSTAATSTTAYVDQLWFNVTYAKSGSLNVTLNNPSTVIITNETINNLFILNATVKCIGSSGDRCGNIVGMARYNSSGIEPTTQISSTPGAFPLFVDTGNQSCTSLNATSGQDTCTLTWQVNATQLGNYNLDVLFASSITSVLNNNTLNAGINVLNSPTLTVNLTSPITDPLIDENEYFDLKCSVKCEGQTCNDVLVSLLYCDGSLICTPNKFLNLTSIGLSSNVSSVNLGSISPGVTQNASFNITGNLSNDYVIQCNSTSSNAPAVLSFEKLALHVNDFPIANLYYPSASEWLSGTETLNASSSIDSDGTINNYKFEIDDNLGFVTPSTICDSASSTCSLNTITQTECSQETSTCYLRLTVTDDDSAINSTIIQVGIDNLGPTTTHGVPINNSYINTESQLINASSTDLGSGVSCVEFDVYYSGGWNPLYVDCAIPFSTTWDLSSVSDQTGIQVRSRANDSEGNFGNYDIHGNITHDTTSPNAVLNYPVNSEIIFSSPYLLNATTSSDTTSGIKNASFYYYDVSWNLIGSDTTPSDGLTFSWDIGLSDGNYDIRVNVTDNAGLIGTDTNTNIVIDLVNDNPVCLVNYPNGFEELNGQIILNASASESDPSDIVSNVSFEYSLNNGTSWNLIGNNLTLNLSEYTFTWDTTLDTDSNEYLIRCNATDNRSGVWSDESNVNFTIDNTAPIINNANINDTDIAINTWICLNVTVNDNLVGVNSVKAEIDVPTGPNENITLVDDGTDCDSVSGDNVYSKNYLSIYDSNYNWTKVYASDDLDNENVSNIGITWTSTSFAFLIAEMIYPTIPFEINESGFNSNFTIVCNITCNESGTNCDNVEITAEYDDGGFIDITTLTSDLVNDEDFYDCGDLLTGQSCFHTFNITSGINSGGNSWDLRCHGSSSNAAADFATPVNLHVNNFPVANFYYPSASEWLSGTETLNASSSTDSDGTINNYKFEIDNNSDFASPLLICDSSNDYCSLNTITQTECSQETSTCYLRLNVSDDDSTKNSTVIQIGIDNIGPTTIQGLPLNNSYIATESQFVNASSIDSGSGISCVEFDAYYDGGWNSINVDCANPYQFNWDLTSITDQKNIEVRSRSNDSEGNFGNYDIHGNITHDTTKPIIELNLPFNQSLINTTTKIFSFTAYENVEQIINCSLILDSVINQTNSSTLNATLTFFTVTGLNEGNHNWYVNCTDSAGNKNSSEVRILRIDLTPPVVLLEFPINNSWSPLSNIEFDYTPSDSYLDSCQLWGNWSNGWHLNDTDSTLFNGSSNAFIKPITDGSYLWNIWCNDSAGNFAFNSTNYTINVDTVYPKIDFTTNTPLNNSVLRQDWIFINVTVNDSNIDSVYFEWQGVNETFENSDGKFFWENKTGLGHGFYTFRAYANDSATNLNSTSLRTVTLDLIFPNWSNQNQTVGGIYSDTVYLGATINLLANWSDTIGLNSSWLSTNATGLWENKTGLYSSPQNIIGLNNQSVFNWSNSSFIPGTNIYWKIYANDLVGNTNSTDVKFFTLWGRSEFGNSFLNPAGIPIGGSTTVNCPVQDNVTLRPLSDYNVSFYNESVYLGSNLTGADGYAKWTFSIYSAGSYHITCNFTNDTAKYYNASTNNQEILSLGVGYGLSIYDYSNTTFNKAYEGIINTTATPIDDPYTDLESNNTVVQDFQSGAGEYAYTRFELKIDESRNKVTKINLTWDGYGENGGTTPGFILYLYNHTSGTWNTEVTRTTNAKYIEYIAKTGNFSDWINSSGYVKLLARSYLAGPTGGAGGNRWARISTDFVELKVQTDILAPTVTLNSPIDKYNSSSSSLGFNCSVYDDNILVNVSLFGEWKNGWHLNETNSSGINNVSYIFNKNINEGTSAWNCYACDYADNCQFASLNKSVNVDLTPPTVNLIYPIQSQNFSGFTIPNLNFSVIDNYEIKNCSLYGNWSLGWHLNKTINSPMNNTDVNFSEVIVEGDNFYVWNVNCTDYAGNSAFNLTNFSFASFLFPDKPILLNANQTKNDGTGDIVLFWNVTNHSYLYKIYAGNNLSNLNFISETFNPNYTDTSFAGNVRKYYRVEAWNPTGQNSSNNYFGAHVYELKHNGNTRNWIGFPTNFSYLADANKTLYEIRNATAFTMWNETIQKRVTCNKFSCPDSYECTDTNCNFSFVNQQGRGYEVNVNDSAPSSINWSGVGIVYSSTNINLVKNSTSFGKNWISMSANTSLTNAQGLIQNISNADALTRWNSSSQKSSGLIPSPFPWAQYLGENFNLNVESGYEVSVTASGVWSQV